MSILIRKPGLRSRNEDVRGLNVTLCQRTLQTGGGAETEFSPDTLALSLYLHMYRPRSRVRGTLPNYAVKHSISTTFSDDGVLDPAVGSAGPYRIVQ